MAIQKSKFKKIFEDNSLSDLQKFRKINALQRNDSRFWIIFISLNAIVLPLLFFIPNVEIDNSNLSPIVAKKD